MRLIDADALYVFFLKMHQSGNTCTPQDVLNAITNATTVQREGWVSVPIEPTDKMWQDAFDIHDITYHGGCQMTDEIMRIKAIYKAMISAAPTDKE